MEKERRERERKGARKRERERENKREKESKRGEEGEIGTFFRYLSILLILSPFPLSLSLLIQTGVHNKSQCTC
jgi:hypothetical protein